MATPTHESGYFSNALPAAAGAAPAAPSDAMAPIRAHYEQGMQKYKDAKYEDALTNWQAALSACKAKLGYDHTVTSQVMNAMGNVLNKLGKDDQALKYYMEALRVHEARQFSGAATDPVARARVLSNIGTLQRKRGMLKEALEHHKRAFDINSRCVKAENVQTTVSVNYALNLCDIGDVYDDQGEYSQALEHYKTALRYQNKAGLSKQHSARVYVGMGNVYMHKASYQLALDYYERGLTIQETTLGKEHPTTALTLSNLGLVYEKLGTALRALELHQQALAIQEKGLSSGHLDIARTHSHLGQAYERLGRLDEALESHIRAQEMREAALGLQHGDTAFSIGRLGFVYRRKGDLRKAMEHHQLAKALFEQVYGCDHVAWAIAVNNLGSLFEQMGEHSMAIQHFQAARDALAEMNDAQGEPVLPHISRAVEASLVRCVM